MLSVVVRLMIVFLCGAVLLCVVAMLFSCLGDVNEHEFEYECEYWKRLN